MVNFCAIVGCANRAGRDKDKSFYRLPAIIKNQGAQTEQLSERRLRNWLAAIRRKDLKAESYPYIRVCSDHFTSGKPAKLYDTTNPDWVPTLNLGHYEAKTGDSLIRHDRAVGRATKRRKLNEEQAIAKEERDNQQESIREEEKRTQAQKDQEKDEVEKLRCELQKSRCELDEVKKELARTHEKLRAHTLDEESFRDNDEKVCFFTGIPKWEVLLVLLTYLKPQLSTASRRALTPFQQLLLTLMRLRLNLSGQDLAYRFNVHSSTVSRTFTYVIEVMCTRLKPLIFWPNRDNLRKTMPMDFRKHCPSCAVIIDCFEIFIERPMNLLARAQTYSSYKHHNTVKYLIGITPQGTVSFISDGWGGRVSDKHLTENCGLLNHLIPGDTVLADRGFDIQDSVGICCARVAIPAFTKGKKQLTGIDVEQTRRIANVRIHVERVIGFIRQKYTFLSGTLPIDFITSRDDGVPLIDKVVVVCCALSNICDSVIPFD